MTTITRVVHRNFEEGAVGQAFIPVYPGPDSYNGRESIAFDGSGSGLGGVYSANAYSGSRSLNFPADPNGSEHNYIYSTPVYVYPTPPKAVAVGIEMTFKGATGCQLDGEFFVETSSNQSAGFRVGSDSGVITYIQSRDTGAFSYPGTNIANQWLTAKVLPDGTSSLSFAGGGVIWSETSAPHNTVNNTTPFVRGGVGSYWNGLYSQVGTVTDLWIDDLVLWVVGDEDPTYLRVHPRDDGLGGGAPRNFPESKFSQKSNRISGYL